MASNPARRAVETPAERVGRSMWADVLNVKDVRPDDTFLDLGGDSLTAMIWLNRRHWE